jgi:hypothetical protein
MEPVTNRQLRQEPSGDRPDGSFYWAGLGTEARPLNQIASLFRHGIAWRFQI